MYNTLSHYLHTNSSPNSPRTVWHQGRNIHRKIGLKVTDSVIKSANQKCTLGGLFCDSAKAFDCVNLYNYITLFSHSQNISKLMDILPNRK
jgi:hypothetical protein